MGARKATVCADHVDYTVGCTDCRTLSRIYAYERDNAIRNGTWERMVEGDALVALLTHMRALLAVEGVTVPRIAAVSGATHSNLYRMLSGRTIRVRPDIAQALWDVSAEMVLSRIKPKLMNSVGAMRRLRALHCDGWDSEALSSLCGMYAGTLTHMRMPRHPTILATNHEIIVRLYEKIQSLADPRGPSPASARWAHNLGYLPAERWADEDIDDPDAEPLPPPPETDDWVAVTNLIEDALRDPHPGKVADYERSVRVEIARQASKRLGWPLPRIAELLGCSNSGVEYMLNGRKDRPNTRKGRRDA